MWKRAAVRRARVPIWPECSLLCVANVPEFTDILACSIVLKDEPFGFFSATGSAEWACTLDDFQLSEETGPTWECCQTAATTEGDGLGQRGLTGSDLAEHLSTYGTVGARAVPLGRDGEMWGALTLYWGPSTRPENLVTPSVAMAATVTEVIERQLREEIERECGNPDRAPDGWPSMAAPCTTSAATFQEREALSEERHARATARDERALARDARAAERDARAAERDALAARA